MSKQQLHDSSVFRITNMTAVILSWNVIVVNIWKDKEEDILERLLP
jgi:hypothetical protein